MASIKFGAIVTDMRGKLGGHSFQKGNQSRVLRTTSIPRASSSLSKIRTQQQVNEVRIAWENLPFEEQENWSVLAANFSRKNKFGDSVAYTARQFFFYTQNNLLRSNQPLQVDSNIFDTTLLPAEPESFVFDTAESNLFITGSEFIETQRYVIRVLVLTKPVFSPSLNRFVYMGSLNSYDTDSEGLYNNTVQRFGPLNSGKNAYVAYYTVNNHGFATKAAIMRADIV